MNEQSNIYLPHLMVIEKITHEAPGVKTFRLKFKDEKEGEAFHFKAGQFGEYSAFGEGESTFCIASSPTRKGYIECTFRQAGRVTTGLAKLEEGATVGFRGPFGNTFPLDEWKGKNLLFVAGGIALPPMRCVIWNALDRRHLIDSTGIIDEAVLDKLKLNIRSLIASQEEDSKDLLDLCIDVIYHNNMKAFGLQQLIKLYLTWLSNTEAEEEEE